MFVKLPGPYHEGRDYSGGTARSFVPFNWSPAPNFRKEEEGYGAVLALEPADRLKGNGNSRWPMLRRQHPDDCFRSAVQRGREGYSLRSMPAMASSFWKVALGAAVQSGPLTYSV